MKFSSSYVAHCAASGSRNRCGNLIETRHNDFPRLDRCNMHRQVREGLPQFVFQGDGLEDTVWTGDLYYYDPSRRTLDEHYQRLYAAA